MNRQKPNISSLICSTNEYNIICTKVQICATVHLFVIKDFLSNKKKRGNMNYAP